MRSLFPRAALLLLALLAPACVREVKIDDQLLRLTDGRLSGPVEVRLPRRADHAWHDLRIEVTLDARCGPRFELEFPDGEHETLAPWLDGSVDKEWQALLEARAKGEPATLPPPVAAPPVAGSQVADPYGAPPPPPPPGHFQAVATEKWQGQLRYLALRDERCGGAPARSRVTHYLAYEERDGLSLFAKVPQEIEGGQLHVVTWEIMKAQDRYPREAERAVAVEETRDPPTARSPRATIVVEKPRPVPVEPPPRREQPGPPGVPGAVFHPGHWGWVDSDGSWRWVAGYWLAPGAPPAARAEPPGTRHLVGEVWHPAHWEWISSDGHWEWSEGFSQAPPPRDEHPGPPPVAGTPWLSGKWIISDGGYQWLPGHFGAAPRPPQPARPAETAPPPPYPGARFFPGDFTWSDGRWQWVAGAYERGDRPPPPPRAERPPPSPSPSAVWLVGWWRFDDGKADYVWIPGHFELPPGEGYVWVPDPVPTRARSFGHWQLRVIVAPPDAPRR